jgi:hypothetical protein
VLSFSCNSCSSTDLISFLFHSFYFYVLIITFLFQKFASLFFLIPMFSCFYFISVFHLYFISFYSHILIFYFYSKITYEKKCPKTAKISWRIITTKPHLKRCEKAKIKGPNSLSLSTENNISNSFQ